MAITFIGQYDSKHYQINHIDGNKLNNHVHNLEVVTPQRNILHAYENDLNTHYGERQILSKLKNTEIEEIVKLYATGRYSRPDIGKMFGVSTPTIARIVTGESRYCKNMGLRVVKIKKWKKSKSAFTYEQAQEIRKEYEETHCSFETLAKKYHVSSPTISRVIKCKGYGINVIDDNEN